MIWTIIKQRQWVHNGDVKCVETCTMQGSHDSATALAQAISLFNERPRNLNKTFVNVVALVKGDHPVVSV
tara:strand:- start:1032 stop:1241 length:210 start_codon:yes stop_codon:yes gene_type:complete